MPLVAVAARRGASSRVGDRELSVARRFPVDPIATGFALKHTVFSSLQLMESFLNKQKFEAEFVE